MNSIREWSAQSPKIKYYYNCGNMSKLFFFQFVFLHITFPWHICTHIFFYAQTCTQALNYGWIQRHSDDTHFVMSSFIALSLCCLQFTFCHLTFTERLMAVLSAVALLLLTLNSNWMNAGSTWRPAQLSLQICARPSGSSGKEKVCFFYA